MFLVSSVPSSNGPRKALSSFRGATCHAHDLTKGGERSTFQYKHVVTGGTSFTDLAERDCTFIFGEVWLIQPTIFDWVTQSRSDGRLGKQNRGRCCCKKKAEAGAETKRFKQILSYLAFDYMRKRFGFFPRPLPIRISR